MTPKKRTLTADEICRIIETCGSTGVTELKCGDFEVFFGPRFQTQTAPPPIPDTAISAAQIEEVTREALDQEHEAALDEQLDRLAVEDPVEYERMKLSGDLEDAGSQNS